MASGTSDSIAFGPEGWLWTTESSGSIGRFNTLGERMSEFKIPTGEGPNEPSLYGDPQSIVRGSDGNMWFVDYGRNTTNQMLVGRITPTGTVNEWPLQSEAESIAEPVEGSDGAMWFIGVDVAAYPTEGSLYRVAPPGLNPATIEKLPIPTGSGVELPGPGENQPEADAVGAEGDVWFSEYGYGNRGFIGRVDPGGHFQQFPLPGNSGDASSLLLGADGNIWFRRGEAIGRITPSGSVLEWKVSGIGFSTSLALGPDGNIWFGFGEVGAIGRITPAGNITIFNGAASAPIEEFAHTPGPDLFYRTYGQVLELAVPLTPAAVSAPNVSGNPEQGGTLTVSQGAWEHGVTSFAYQWESCDATGSDCSAIPGETGGEIVAAAGDVGKTLRATVTATNVAGSASTVSTPSAVISAPPDPTAPGVKASPIVRSTMGWKFGFNRHYTLAEVLTVEGLPGGAEVEVRCQGGGCPFSHRSVTEADAVSHRCRTRRCRTKPVRLARGELDLVPMLHSAQLLRGDHITVVITKPGWIGKQFRFTTRHFKQPAVAITCLKVDSRTRAIGCEASS